MTITRRGFVSAAAFAAGRSAVPVLPAAGLFVPGAAQAEPVTTTLAIASTIAGMVAAHNRRGSEAVLTALGGKIDVVVAQTASIQQAVSTVLEKLAALRGEIDGLFRQSELRTQQAAVRATAVRYVDRIQSVRQLFPTLQEFRRQDGVMRDVQDLLNDLYRAVSTLDAVRAYGPSSALVLPSAFIMEYALLTIRGDDPRVVTARLERNIALCDRFADPRIPESTESYRATAAARLDDLTKAALANPLGRQLGLKPGSIPFDCVGADVAVEKSQNPFRWQTRLANPVKTDIQERMFSKLVFSELEVSVPGVEGAEGGPRTADFRIPTVMKETTGPVRFDDPRVPGKCRMEGYVQLPGLDAHRKHMEERLDKFQGNADLKALWGILGQMGEERGRQAFGIAALGIMADARAANERLVKGLKR